MKVHQSIFLFCFNRLFSIRLRQKGGYSLELSEESAAEIEDVFQRQYIPYRTAIEDERLCIIDKPTEEDPAPANSRVIFEIKGIEFHILNYNDWLIKKHTAEIICKALDNNFITSRVDSLGKYANVSKVPLQKYTTSTNDKKQYKPEEKLPEIQKLNPSEVQKIKTSPYLGPVTMINYFGIDPFSSYAPTAEETIKPGQTVIAVDEYYGTYKGVFINTFSTPRVFRAVVKILECMEMPSQKAILYPDALCNRDPYKPEELQNFDYEKLTPFGLSKIA